MAAKLPFPYPCQDSPRFDTQHWVATLIAEYQDWGHIKKCAHVHIERFDNVLDKTSTYGPGCHKDSFVVREDPDGDYQLRYFYGCPKECRLYRSAWVEKTEDWLNTRWRDLRRTIVAVFQWYASLSAVTQAILALAILALVGAPWRDTILEGLKIVFGK